MTQTKAYKHNCGDCCKFVGNLDGLDGYVCYCTRQPDRSSLLLRYGNEPNEYYAKPIWWAVDDRDRGRTSGRYQSYMTLLSKWEELSKIKKKRGAK